MDDVDTLRKFVNQRLTAAADEILAVFGRTIVQYQQEIDRQRRQLHSLNPPEIKCKEFVHFPACEDEVPAEQPLRSIGVGPVLVQDVKQEAADEEEECEMTETTVNFDSDSEFISIDDQGMPHSSSDISEKDAEDGGGGSGGDNHIKEDPLEEAQSGSSSSEKGGIEPQLLQSAADQLLSPLSCKVCKLTFADTISLRRHVQNHPRDCGLCGKHLEPTETLKHHFIGHKTCIVCGKVCSSISALEMHVRSHVGDKPFRCSVCGRSFVQKGNLKSHMTIHMNDKPFSCSICGKTFRWKVSVQKHMRTHPEEPVRYIGLDGTIEHRFLNLCSSSSASSSVGGQLENTGKWEEKQNLTKNI